MYQPKVRREIGPLALMLTGLGSIIGSGWLFGAWHTAQLAGPGAVYAWILGAAIIAIIALAFSELGAMFPETGGMVRYGYYSHGSLVGFIAGWANWISIVSVIPVEAEASVQYMASWPYAWAHHLYAGQELSPPGLALAAVLVVGYFLLNYWGVRLYVLTNGAITAFKLVVPAATAIALILAGFHPGNFAIGLHPGHAPMNISAILAATATSGIVFSFNGFQSPINLAGEARNPGLNVPLGVFGSIALATVIYVLLQIAFVGATPPGMLVHGWSAVNFSSPFAQLAFALNLNWLALLLYADAFISPSGTGATYTATTSRMIFAMERSGALPKIFGRIHPGSGAPRPAMWLNLLVSFLFLFFFRGWGSLAAVISVACIVSYLAGPVSVAALRRTAPDMKRPLRTPALGFTTGAAFVLSTLLLYWARWPLTGEVLLLILIAAPIYIWAEAKAGWRDFGQHLHAAWWLVVYLPTLALVSFLGSHQFGGIGVIPFGFDLGLVALIGLGFFVWGVRSGWRTPALELHGKGADRDEALI
ncbi:MAG: APC family permease [Caulobacteraceae bacterium]